MRPHSLDLTAVAAQLLNAPRPQPGFRPRIPSKRRPTSAIEPAPSNQCHPIRLSAIQPAPAKQSIQPMPPSQIEYHRTRLSAIEPVSSNQTECHPTRAIQPVSSNQTECHQTNGIQPDRVPSNQSLPTSVIQPD